VNSEEKMQIRSMTDMVVAVPYLLGFHPADGSIVVAAKGESGVPFVARTDLPGPGPIGWFTDQLVQVVRRQQGVAAVVVLGYGEPERVEPVLRAVGDAFTGDGTAIHDLIRVTGRRAFSLVCTDPDCCPPEGIAYDPATSVAAVQATVAGRVAYPDRDTIAARLMPVVGQARQRMRHATDHAVQHLEVLWANGGEAALLRAGEEAVRTVIARHDLGRRLTYAQTAWLSVVLTDSRVRDFALTQTQARLEHVQLWAQVTRRAQPPFTATPAVLLAITAWRCSDGVLAQLAAEHALALEPSHELAALVVRTLQAGMPPSELEQVLATLTRPDTGPGGPA